MLCSTSVELRHHCELTKKTLISTAYKFLYHKKFRSGFLSSHQKRVSLFALPGHCSLRVSVLTIVIKSKVYARQGWPRPEVAQRLPAYLKSSKPIFLFLSAAANSKIFFPAPWLDGKDLEQHPVNIWYWVREQSFSPPRSCAEIQLRGSYSKPLTGKKTLSTQIGFLLCRRHSWAYSCQSQARPIKIHMFLSSLKCRYLLTEHLIRTSFVESFLNIWTFDQGYHIGDWREIIK